MNRATEHSRDLGPTLEPFATWLRFGVEVPISAANWGELVREFIRIVTVRCAVDPELLIGHIKGFSRFPGGGYLKVSSVAAGIASDVEVRGDAADSCREIDIALNVLVYGAGSAHLGELVRAALDDIENGWRERFIQGTGPAPHRLSAQFIEREEWEG